MIFSIDTTDKTSFCLTPEQGGRIRELITQQIDISFRYYLQTYVGLEESNVSAILSGKRNMTIGMLRRILSGTRIELELCTLNFTLENTSGGIVQTADLPTLEEMLSLQEQNESGEHTPDQIKQDVQQILEQDSPSSRSPEPSSSSEKVPGKLKTLLASRSWEKPEESSDSSSPD